MANPLEELTLSFETEDRGVNGLRLYVRTNFGVGVMLMQHKDPALGLGVKNPKASGFRTPVWGATLSQCCGRPTQEVVPTGEHSCIQCFGAVPVALTVAQIREVKTVASLLPLTINHLDSMAAVMALEVFYDVINALAKRPPFYWRAMTREVGLEVAQRCLARETVGIED